MPWVQGTPGILRGWVSGVGHSRDSPGLGAERPGKDRARGSGFALNLTTPHRGWGSVIIVIMIVIVIVIIIIMIISTHINMYIHLCICICVYIYI